MSKLLVLFVCEKNSARSQMAAALLNKYAGDHFTAESAGLEAGVLNPYAVEALKQDEGIDISNNPTRNVFEIFKGKSMGYSYVITVCSDQAAEKCPMFPNILNMWRWYFDDPAYLGGSEEDKLKQTIVIKNQIKEKVLQWIEYLKSEE